MDNFQIETAQNVQITQNIASLGDRIKGYLLDLLILLIYEIFALIILNSIFNSHIGSTRLIALFSILGLPPFLYDLVMETFNNGQSIGKMIVKTRVVKLDGSPAHFSNYLLRWVLRIVDFSIGSGVIALLTFLLNGKGQRLGDIVAKTTVISEQPAVQLEDTLAVDLSDDYKPVYPQVTLLTDAEITEIKTLYKKAIATQNEKVLDILAKKVANIIDVRPEETAIPFIAHILSDYTYYTQ